VTSLEALSDWVAIGSQMSEATGDAGLNGRVTRRLAHSDRPGGLSRSDFA